METLGWDAFLTRPALYIEASRLAACFGGQLDAAFCARLQTSSRLEKRLSDRVRSHYGLASEVTPGTLNEADRAVALEPAEQLTELVRRAGAIFWANTIASAILAADVKAVHAALGESLAAYAIVQRDLSGPVQPLKPLDQVGQRVIHDGLRCLGAWSQVQPDGVGARVRLKLAADPALDGPVVPPFDKLGAAIVRRAAG